MSNTNIKFTNSKEVYTKIPTISQLITYGKYDDALAEVLILNQKYKNDFNIFINFAAFFIDIGTNLSDYKLVREGIDRAEKVLENDSYIEFHLQNYYNAANGYEYIYKVEEFSKEGLRSIPTSDLLQKQKRYLRKIITSATIPEDILKMALTNYANLLDFLGRGIEASWVYDKCIELDNSFSMAIANKAKALQYFADITGEYRKQIYIHSYQIYKGIIADKNLMQFGGASAVKVFEEEMHKIEELIGDPVLLEKSIDCLPVDESKFSTFERYFTNICTKYDLYMNTHIHSSNCEAAIIDPIFMSMKLPIEDNTTYYHLSKFINQIKEDYVTSRYLFVKALFLDEELLNISHKTTFANTNDTAMFNLPIGLLKSSFKNGANILDKIVIFLNTYLNLGKDNEKIFWFTDKRDDYHKFTIWENKSGVREEIVNLENLSLYALHDLYLDFKIGEYKKLIDLRNHLTHRTFVIFKDKNDYTDSKIPSISYDEFISNTADLLRLLKAATIYLINFINTNEHRKSFLTSPKLVSTEQIFPERFS